jgi:hypothetical protein
MAHRFTTLAAATALTAGLLGCTTTHQFSGQLRYGNLMTHPIAEDATAAAKQQLIELAQAYGLEARHIGESRMTFVAQAPTYSVTQPDGGIEERRDPRVVKIDVILDEHVGRHTYRYYCSIEGNEPANFTDEDRSRFGLALLAVREIFEKPIATDFLGG